jgi:subtilisin family serine protease
VRPHIGIQLRSGVPADPVPHWVEILHDKTPAADSLHPAVDSVLSRRGVPAWITREYRPAASDWSAEELRAGLNRVYRIILRRDSGIPPGLVEEIALLPIVEEARPGRIAVAELPPARATAMAGGTDQRSRDAIFLAEAHRYSRGDPEIVVAVLDTGVCLTHPELKHCLVSGQDFVDIIDGHGEFVGDFLGLDESPDDEVGHGTHVAGIICGAGIAMPSGVAPRCRLMPVRVLGAMKRGETRVGAGLVDNINGGVKWAIDHGADLINMSLGVQHTGGGLPHQEVVEYARLKGVTIVAASGNDGQEGIYYPGGFPSVITVGAEDRAGSVAAFSTYGRQVSLIAPGTDVYSSYLENDYAFSSGTSHAAPFVSGAVALMKSYARSRGRRLTDGQVKSVLKNTADKVGRAFKDRKAGYGRLNLSDAMRLLENSLN